MVFGLNGVPSRDYINTMNSYIKTKYQSARLHPLVIPIWMLGLRYAVKSRYCIKTLTGSHLTIQSQHGNNHTHDEPNRTFRSRKS